MNFCILYSISHYGVLKPFHLGDILVSIEKLEDGHVVWGTTIISLMFLPNLVFLIWMVLGSYRQLCHRDTCLRLLAGDSIQCVTIFRYVYLENRNCL